MAGLEMSSSKVLLLPSWPVFYTADWKEKETSPYFVPDFLTFNHISLLFQFLENSQRNYWFRSQKTQRDWY